MRSYASIDRIEGEYAVCEVELVDTTESKTLSSKDKETNMVDILVQVIIDSVGKFLEGDILVVEQKDGEILIVYENDEEEKQRRIELLKSIMKK